MGSDPEIQSLMESYMTLYEEGLSQKIGESLVDLDAREDRLRRGETNLGDLVADSWTERFPAGRHISGKQRFNPGFEDLIRPAP